MEAWFYILRLKSGRLYAGITTNLQKRYKEHLKRYACRTTKIDPVIALVYSENFPNVSSARKREIQVKKWTHAKKEALIAGDVEILKRLSSSGKNLIFRKVSEVRLPPERSLRTAL
ncbi:MAG: GIY-YIG nuclease family protein [Candidatus Omnitrophota bacterium]|nr:GIY-YIG nuclease family protein [Candidatus Omnitrophota bacterium]